MVSNGVKTVSKQDAFLTRHFGLMRRRAMGVLCALTLIMGITISPASPAQGDQNNPQNNPKPKVSREQANRQKALQKEMTNPYREWLEEEVPYIITVQEQAALKKLATDDDREAFIQNFWERRNPHPGSLDNEYQVEYYQRIAYANENYGTGIPGWKTDRGRIYIMYGPPDEIDSHPSGGQCQRPDSEGGGSTLTYPFEQWRYHYIDGIGTNVILEFVDPTITGEYHLTMNPSEKDALLFMPHDNLTLEQMPWYAPKYDKDPSNRLDNRMKSRLLPNTLQESMDEFTRLDLYTRVSRLPPEKSQDLKAVLAPKEKTKHLKPVVLPKLSVNPLPFDERTDFIRATNETVLAPVTIQIAKGDIQFQNNDGVMHGAVDIYGEIGSLDGRIVYAFGKRLALDVPEREFPQYQNYKCVFQEVVPLPLGRYRLSLVLKDDLSGHVRSEELGIVVPSFSEGNLAHTSLILADQIQPLPTSQVGSSPFVIGGMKVRPSLDNTFTHDQTLGIYMQVYNLGIDDKTHKPSLDVRYEVEKDGKAVLDQPEDGQTLKKASQQFTVSKKVQIKQLAPGKYTVQVMVTDNIKKQTITPSATLEVR